jgi:hypothetical protein
MFSLIIYIYIQTFSKGDYPALTNAGQFKTEAACVAAGRKAQQGLNGIGTLKWVCLDNGD